jgi:predicted MFS family arabinose efflux permease
VSAVNSIVSQEPPAVLSAAARRYALALLVVVYTFNFIDRQILAILLPAIQAEFGINDSVLGFLAGSAFALFYATLGVPIALLADRWNRRNLIAIAVAVWSGMTALSGLAANVLQLALARVGVGIGEAGCSPPAHSMIADLYPPALRSTAMGVFTLGISAGIMIAYLAGGWVAENIGWREAFFIVGIPGLVLALLVRLTIREPVRGQSEGRVDTAERAGVVTVAKFLLARRSFLHLAVGSGLASFGGYAVISFFPTFLYRSHAMNLSEIGVYLGFIIGIAGGLGFAGGGWVADRLGRRSQKYALWGVAGAMLAGWLFLVPVYLVGDPHVALAFFVIPTVLSNFYLATTFAQIQGLVKLRMRAVASALLLFILNIIGLGLGPQLTGILSDQLAPGLGTESMRYSLLIVACVVSPWAAWHYFAAGHHIEADLARAEEP